MKGPGLVQKELPCAWNHGMKDWVGAGVDGEVVPHVGNGGAGLGHSQTEVVVQPLVVKSHRIGQRWLNQKDLD